MIRVRQIEIPVDAVSEERIKKEIARKLKIPVTSLLSYQIKKESIDARRKPDLFFVYEMDVQVKDEKSILKKNKGRDLLKTPNEDYQFHPTGEMLLSNRPVIVGAGPAGLFATYMLASEGYRPLLLERGKCVEERKKDVETFWETGILNPESNVQFGEGGAGTFSDGKLNTLVKDKENRGRKVFEIFVKHGAPKEILYKNKPHIGTDILFSVIQNMRNEIIKMGGEIRYNTRLTDLNIVNNKLESIIVNEKEVLKTDILVLAIGHSSRDTFFLLHDKKIKMEPKPFAVGVRMSHPQKWIDKSQYGVEEHPILGASSYKLTYHAKNGRGVYTFCMCPGGYVVNSSSEKGYLAINGMSNYARDSKVANAAILVTICPTYFGNSALDGIFYQKELEKKAYELGYGKIPIQRLEDFKEDRTSKQFHCSFLSFKGEYKSANLNFLFDDAIQESLKEGIAAFGKKIKGFDDKDAVLAAVESRTSSPIRILRNDVGEANIEGIYPCGEGAGYAGGITSASMDGIKVYEWIAKKYTSFESKTF